MATWYLLNTIKFNSSQSGINTPTLLEGGKLIDDTKYNLTAIKAAGGVVVPSTDAAATAASLLCATARHGGQGDQSPATLLDLLMIAAVAGQSNASSDSRVKSTRVAGSTVAAAAAIVPAITFTPAFSGKLKITAWASPEALASGTFTPVLKQATVAIAAPAQYTGSADAVPGNVYVDVEVDGLTVGTAYTFNFVTTTGDATVTLGNGSTGIAASMTVQELP
jgi:hypothetical protein